MAEELKKAVKDGLAASGELEKIRSQLRFAIHSLLKENMAVLGDNKAAGGDTNVPKKTWMLNELIRQYLHFHGHSHTLHMFVDETGGKVEDPIDTAYLADQLHLKQTPSDLPLLYYLFQ